MQQKCFAFLTTSPRLCIAFAALYSCLIGCGPRASFEISDTLVDPTTAEFAGVPSPVLGPNTKWEQTLVAPHNGLDKIDIYLATYTKRIPSGALKFRLLTVADHPLIVAAGSIPLADIKDNAFAQFAFPPLCCSRQKKYSLQLATADMPSGYMLSAWVSKQNLYAPGEFLVNGVPLSGDVGMAVHSMVNPSENVQQ